MQDYNKWEIYLPQWRNQDHQPELVSIIKVAKLSSK